jgi:hypothetical protein
MPVELRTPEGLALLGLLVPLIVLYILKVRRERVPVASTWLWASARRDLLAKQPFQRLIAQTSLVLEALAIVALALALARPSVRGTELAQGQVAVVIDTSASMGAVTQAGTTRLAEAQRVAREVLGSLGPGGAAILIEAAHSPLVALPLERDLHKVRAAVEALEVRDVEGRLGPAVALAHDRLKGLAGARRIVVITDGALANSDTFTRSSLPLEVRTVGAPIDNTAIVRVDVRAGRDRVSRREELQVFALVAHYGAQPRDVFVTLRQRNVTEPLASRRLKLAPGERTPVVLTFEPTPQDRGSGIVVEVSPPDALARDDRAYGRVPPPRRLPVALAPPTANPWIRRALAADPEVLLSVRTLPELSSEAVPEGALVVVDGACPAALPGGDVLLLNPPPGECRGTIVGAPLERPRVTTWAEADPRFRFLSLEGVELLEARRLEVKGRREALVETREGAIVADVSSPGRTATLVGFDVGRSNWPLRASFVLFVRNTVELARDRRDSGAGIVRTGTPIPLNVPPSAERVDVEDPSGKRFEVTAREGAAVIPETSRAGFYWLSFAGTPVASRVLAVNLTSEAESDLRRTLPPSESGAIRSGAAGIEGHVDASWMLAALALLFLAADVFWLTRAPRTRRELLRPQAPERSTARQG